MFTLFVYLVSIRLFTHINSGGLQGGGGSSPGTVNRQTTPMYLLPNGPSERCGFEPRNGQQTDNSNVYYPK